jgi:replication initiation protein RepC
MVAIVAKVPRVPTLPAVTDVLDEMRLLQAEVLNRLVVREDSENLGTNGAQIERHIQNSKPESLNELEPRSEKEQGATVEPERRQLKEPIKAFPLAMVLKACPQINDYARGGQISQWRELMSAAVVVRSTLGVSPSAYQDACEVMGPENAATVVACMLERAGQINSAGGYLRDLTRKAAQGEFSLGPMIIALMRANEGNVRAAS